MLSISYLYYHATTLWQFHWQRSKPLFTKKEFWRKNCLDIPNYPSDSRWWPGCFWRPFVVSGDFASGCLHAVGFVGVIAQVGCICLGLRSAYCEHWAVLVSRQWRGWQLAPANYATWDSIRAGRGRRGCHVHTAGHPSGKTTPCQIPTYAEISWDYPTCDISRDILV